MKLYLFIYYVQEEAQTPRCFETAPDIIDSETFTKQPFEQMPWNGRRFATALLPRLFGKNILHLSSIYIFDQSQRTVEQCN